MKKKRSRDFLQQLQQALRNLSYIQSSVYEFTHTDIHTDTGRDIVASAMKHIATKNIKKVIKFADNSNIEMRFICIGDQEVEQTCEDL